MSTTSTPQRPSHPRSISTTGTPRRVSSSSDHSALSPPVTIHDRKKRNRTLLRDYYGLNSKPGSNDPDAPESFNPVEYVNDLTLTKSLPHLLRKETDLVNEIRELDGERQSLVYNHHHELIQASDTIRKMKSRAEALDTSLDSLQTSFEKISQLSTSLASLVARPVSSSRRRRRTSTTTTTTTSEGVDRHGSSRSPTRRVSATAAAEFSRSIHLAPLLALPIVLRVLLLEHDDDNVHDDDHDGDGAAEDDSTIRTRSQEEEEAEQDLETPKNDGRRSRGGGGGGGGSSAPPRLSPRRDNANQNDLMMMLWGSWEPALTAWREARVAGVDEVANECRQVLLATRRRRTRTTAVGGGTLTK